MKCFHHNDADGRCAAAIVARFKGGMAKDFIEMDYKTPVNLTMVGPGETVYIVDFSFKPDDWCALKERTQDVVWIDHHKTCKNYPYASENIPGVRDFTDMGPAACALTWDYLAHDTHVPRGVCLIGDYDSWRMAMAPDSTLFRVGVELEDQSVTSLFWPALFDEANGWERASDVIEAGRVCIRYRDRYCSDMCKAFGFETEIAGVEAYACNLFRFGSQQFGERMKRYEVCIAFAFDGTTFTCSVYSERPEVDCAAICQRFGGGGHKGAAGFTCSALPFLRKTE